ncbi:Calcineurin-like phosphoesterase superfamily domain protein [Pseudovibrio axinellae]|uniref:Calcineurin-like phosphoesterase superfamily domain protein n=1 Tax=Pseudovibrio axinellae TaxID=989403 RepID=A0A165XTA5_9HYPH|nr:metallophosphoesterase [Pseudovibrio axinellae]KZL18017.1 Calcineurin-like phosphoesterase superfamily domain protein [Pseudovibrio axinellae]SER13367.1 3',5'-cyclic AMP phosphodiesterase CpdA [Pseudovibrio axinellae]
MFKLAHFSDPHLGPLPDVQPAQLASKRLIGYLNWRRNRAHAMTNSYLDALIHDIHAQEPDHIALCGDLVNIALPKEISGAKEWLPTVGSPEDLSLTPGNHDAYVPGALKKAYAAWRPYMQSDPELAVATTNANPPRFPFVRRRGKITIIGVSSARASSPFLATGYINNNQLRALGEQLQHAKARGDFRVVLLHHPPVRNATSWYKRLVGSSRFRNVIAEHGAELILHGHTHRATQMEIIGPEGPVPVICVPSASNGIGRHTPPARYNLYSIEQDGAGWSCIVEERGFSTAAEGVHHIAQHDLRIPGLRLAA